LKESDPEHIQGVLSFFDSPVVVKVKSGKPSWPNEEKNKADVSATRR